MPGADYQKICDHLREVYNVDYPIISPVAEGMIRTMKYDLKQADDILSGLAEDTYYNDRLTILRGYAFAYSKVRELICPNVKRAGGYACTNCKSLKKAELPALTNGGTSALFASCTALEYADMGNTDSVSANTFLSCGNLMRVILRGNTVSSLQNVSAFTGTPYATNGTGGKIYVPEALIEEYKTATNWSVLYGYGKCEFVPIEGSEYE